MIKQAVLKYIRADVLIEALLPKLDEVSPENLSALKIRLADWNRKTKTWRRPCAGAFGPAKPKPPLGEIVPVEEYRPGDLNH